MWTTISSRTDALRFSWCSLSLFTSAEEGFWRGCLRYDVLEPRGIISIPSRRSSVPLGPLSQPDDAKQDYRTPARGARSRMEEPLWRAKIRCLHNRASPLSYSQWENPRLCRGGSSSLTFPGVHPETLRREPPSTPQGETGWTSMQA